VLYGFYLKPKYEGKGATKHSRKTTVYFDDFWVPHLSNNSIDAMTALGYVHAQDRLWQMELMRRTGRLSEISEKCFKERYVFRRTWY
jgi:penicillin amidase